MKESDILEELGKIGAVVTNSHVVYTSRRHGTAYVDKDTIYPHTKLTSDLCRAIAEQFVDDIVEAVVAPEKGGIILSQWIAYHLSELTGREVLAFYAEKTEDGGFVIKRGGAAKKLPGKNVLIGEDVLTTGGSAKKVIEVTRSLGCNVVGLGVLCNRGGITSADVANPPKLFALINVKLDSWDEAECAASGPCSKGVLINTSVGKGADYLAEKGK